MKKNIFIIIVLLVCVGLYCGFARIIPKLEGINMFLPSKDSFYSKVDSFEIRIEHPDSINIDGLFIAFHPPYEPVEFKKLYYIDEKKAYLQINDSTFISKVIPDTLIKLNCFGKYYGIFDCNLSQIREILYTYDFLLKEIQKCIIYFIDSLETLKIFKINLKLFNDIVVYYQKHAYLRYLFEDSSQPGKDTLLIHIYATSNQDTIYLDKLSLVKDSIVVNFTKDSLSRQEKILKWIFLFPMLGPLVAFTDVDISYVKEWSRFQFFIEFLLTTSITIGLTSYLSYDYYVQEFNKALDRYNSANSISDAIKARSDLEENYTQLKSAQANVKSLNYTIPILLASGIAYRLFFILNENKILIGSQRKQQNINKIGFFVYPKSFLNHQFLMFGISIKF